MKIIDFDFLENLPAGTAIIIKCPLDSKIQIDVLKVQRRLGWQIICYGNINNPESKELGETCCFLDDWISQNKPLELVD